MTSCRRRRATPASIPPKQIAALAGIIRRFGFRGPIWIDSRNEIIAGEGRWLAAKLAGLTEVPVIDCSDLSDAEIRALRLADNRIALESSWDEDLLTRETR